MSKNNKHNKIKKSLSIILTVFLGLTVCFCLFVAIQSLTRGYVSLGNTSFFRVITGSMEPTVSIGELIMTDNMDIEDINVDDIVCFSSRSSDMSGAIITHRVVEITSTEDGDILLITKGDANLSVDSHYVTAENLIGKMVWSSGDTAISNIVAFLSGGSGFFICIVLPSILILLVILHENARAMKRDIDVLVKKIKENEQANESDKKPLIDEEEYNQMRERIRQELMEELNNHDESEQS